MSARISVVVPIYNVAAYLEPCLESLAHQTMGDLEVVMVDDGSTDASIEIANRFVARDPRFKLVRQANAGLGAARNTGVAHATGEFVAFADSDDLVPPQAYEVLIGALDKTGSDFAAGNVRRLTPFGTAQAAFLAKTFARTRLQTHISRFPYLVLDRTAWNKLFRKSFWDEHGFRFPEGVLYEDIPVTLPAHHLAKSVDVVDQTVYLWRMREGGDLSITQRRTETKALRDRVSSVSRVSRFLAEQRLTLSKSLYDHSVVGSDLRLFLDVLPSADEDFRQLFVDLVNDFFDQADPWVLDQPLAIDRLKWQLVRRRSLPELLEVIRFGEEEIGEVPPLRGRRYWYGDYPYRTDKRLRIPRSVYRLRDELGPVFKINDLRWEGDTLRIEGYAYIDLIGAPTPDSQDVELVVRPVGWPVQRVRLPTERSHRPDVTACAAQELVGLDWSGFVATLDTRRLNRGGRWRDRSWEIGVVLRAGGVVRRSWRAEPAPLFAPPLAQASRAAGTRLEAGVSSVGDFTLRVRRERAAVTWYELDDGVLELEGDAGFVAASTPTLRVSRSGGASALAFPAHIDRFGSRPTFVARVPIEELLRQVDTAGEPGEAEQHADGVAWEVYLAGDGSRKKLALPESVPESTWTIDGREVAVERTREGNFTIVERSSRPVITGVEWSPGGILLLTGSFRSSAGEYELVLGARRHAQVYRAPVRYDLESGRFTAELTPAAVASLAGTRPLSGGLWEILVGRAGGAREAAVSAVFAAELLDRLPVSTAVGHKRFHVGVFENEFPALAVERDLAEDERGGLRQRNLRTSYYAEQREREVRDLIVYDSFAGREYSDSPRALHEELVRRGAPFEHLWVVRDGACQVPDTAVPVREQSRECYEAFARGRYLIANDHWPRWFVRRPEQTCLQTWHGAPLKRHGYDLADRPRAVRAYRHVLQESADNWEYVVSAGPSATPIVQRAFPVGAEVLETGLPRTDLLRGPDRDSRAEEVRRRLDLGGKRVVLYAPTYRDHLAYRGGYRLSLVRDLPTYRAEALHRDGYRLGPLLDLAAVSSALGDDYELLFRKHRDVVDPLPVDAERVVRDVSEYPDATELLLIADVLVTDYSSAVFDFASTGRPIVFFTPDLAEYRDEIRGFSIDFEGEAPGPLLRTTEEVVDALKDPEGVSAAYRGRYEAFVASYCSLNDGGASSRVVDRIFDW